MHHVQADLLERLAHAVGIAIGSPEDEAAEMARHLVGANLAGHDSHGIGMIPDYVRLAKAGLLVPGRSLETLVDMGALLVFEAGRGCGQWMARRAMERGIGRAREMGCCTVALRNAAHVGRIGHYAEICAEAGMASVHFVNVADHDPLQAPFGCSDARLGTNPFAAALPGKRKPSVVLDMATSAIAFGKARVARNKGVPVPEGSLIDGEGMPTTDPTTYVDSRKGALRSFGLHKGSGLAVMCELMGAALTGGQTIQPAHPRHDGILNSMLSIIIDVEAIGDRDTLADEIDAVAGYSRRSPPAPGFERILMPGEPENLSRAQRRKEGIPLDTKSLSDILAAAIEAGVPDDCVTEIRKALT